MNNRRVIEEGDPTIPSPAEPAEQDVPRGQQLYQSIWLWAGLAIVFWALSYIIWGFVDLISLPPG